MIHVVGDRYGGTTWQEDIIWRRDSVWVSDAATIETEVDTIEKQEAQGYCHRRGKHTCGEAASGSVVVSTKAAIVKEATLLMCWL